MLIEGVIDVAAHGLSIRAGHFITRDFKISYNSARTIENRFRENHKHFKIEEKKLVGIAVTFLKRNIKGISFSSKNTIYLLT